MYSWSVCDGRLIQRGDAHSSGLTSGFIMYPMVRKYFYKIFDLGGKINSTTVDVYKSQETSGEISAFEWDIISCLAIAASTINTRSTTNHLYQW